MKKWKVILTTLAMMLVFQVTAYANASGTCGANAYWELNGGVLTVYGSGAMDLEGKASAPWAPYNNQIISVEIEPGITEIDSNAFINCYNLRTASIPDTVSQIKGNAFMDCTSLQHITVPESVVNSGKAAFSGCTSLKTATIGAYSLTQFAFSGCTALESVTFTDHTKYIGMLAFENCTALKEITIPENVTEIKDFVFYRTDSLKAINVDRDNKFFSSANGLLLDKEGTTLLAVPYGLRHVEIPDGVTTIVDQAFQFNKVVESVYMPDSVTELGTHVFRYCESLKDVRFSKNITVLPEATLFDCNSMKTIVVPDGITKIESDAVYTRGTETLVVPASVREFNGLFFSDCVLKNIYFGGSKVQWDSFFISKSEYLQKVKIHYNSSGLGQTATVPAAKMAYAATQNVNVDGVPVKFEAYALKDKNGNATNYVKLRDVAYVLNGTAAQFAVGWDGSVNIITDSSYTATGSEMKTPFSGNRSYAVSKAVTKINGSPVAMDAITLTDDKGGGYTYYKLRDLGKALGFNVGWSSTAGIYIETDQPYMAN